MILFILLTIISVAGVVLRQSALRYLASTTGAKTAGGKGPAFSWPDYSRWLRRRGKAVLSKGSWKRGWAVLKKWASSHYPGWLGWIFAALLASFVYQAASGFAFALLSPRGMFGFPLLAHVGLGGLFSVSLAAMLFWRARDYRFDRDETAIFEGFACPVFKNLSKAMLRKILFWAFAFFGLVQVTTALGSMLPVFTFRAQLAMIMIHRFSALAILLTAIVFADITFLPMNKYGDTSLNSGIK